MDYKLILMLEDARVKSGVPYFISSGCRCPAHNKEVGGAADSAHLTRVDDGEFCQAVDIETDSSIKRFHIIRGLFAAGFTRLGFGKNQTFIHADIDSNKPQNVFFQE